MAALRLIAAQQFSKNILNGQIRSKSTKFPTSPLGHLSHVDKVATTKDGTMFVALHPTTDFPYEYSKPLPPKAIPTATLLKDQAIQTAMAAFGNKKPEIARLELMKLTNTSLHSWKPRPRDRKAKKNSMDREYL